MLESIQNSFDTNILPYLQSPLFIGGVVGIILVLLIVFLVIRSRTRAMRIFKTHAGSVHVSRAALRDLVYSACRRVNTANRPRVTFFPKYGKLNLSVKLKLIEGQRMTDVTAQLQARIAEALHETLSMEKVGNINIFFTGIQRDKNAKPIVPSEHVASMDEAPRKSTESYVIASDEDVYDEHDTSKATDDEDLEVDAPKETSKRGFLGFGRSKVVEEPSVEDDALVLDDEPVLDSDGLVKDEAEDEKKV